MIDIVTNNVRQVGTPSEEDRIYISDKAYRRIHTQEFSDKRVFVFVGHTESAGGRYATFIEAAIAVTEISFEQNLPVWSNKAWSEVFREVKNNYDDSIIVGWAIDLKGFSPKVTTELQRIHREHFGGMHQLLMLLDSLQGEEGFYLNQSGSLMKRTGFFIYYKVEEKKKIESAEVELEIPESFVNKKISNEAAITVTNVRPRYREAIKTNGRTRVGREYKANKESLRIPGMMVTAMLVAALGLGVYNKYFGNTLETNAAQQVEVIEMKNYSTEQESSNQPSSETGSDDNQANHETGNTENKEEGATGDATVNLIPVEKVPQE